jgi:hypothetical protein
MQQGWEYPLPGAGSDRETSGCGDRAVIGRWRAQIGSGNRRGNHLQISRSMSKRRRAHGRFDVRSSPRVAALSGDAVRASLAAIVLSAGAIALKAACGRNRTFRNPLDISGQESRPAGAERQVCKEDPKKRKSSAVRAVIERNGHPDCYCC